MAFLVLLPLFAELFNQNNITYNRRLHFLLKQENNDSEGY